MKKLKVKVHLIEDKTAKCGCALYKTMCKGKTLITTTKINSLSVGLNIVFSTIHSPYFVASSAPETTLPKIPTTFINKFIKVYGTNTITDALVNIDDSNNVITRNDGTCIISKIKDTFTREELVNAAIDLAKQYGKDLTGDRIDDYINSLTT